MLIFKNPAELQRYTRDAVRAGQKIALVPTMGFLHAGHASLIDLAARRAEVVIVSIFVNPTQFAPTEDLDQYPRDFAHDCELCEKHGATAVFAPEPDAMYASDRSIWVDETTLSKVLCGQTRPIHFRGVLTVVAKLFNLARPDFAVFGRKDAQQLIIIKRMVRDLNFPVEIVPGDLIRDTDGVALSSRNRYLSPEERLRARALSQALFAAEKALADAPRAAIAAEVAKVRAALEAAADRVDYVEARDAENLEEPTAQTREILLAAAAYFGTTRLIDNRFIRIGK